METIIKRGVDEINQSYTDLCANASNQKEDWYNYLLDGVLS